MVSVDFPDKKKDDLNYCAIFCGIKIDPCWCIPQEIPSEFHKENEHNLETNLCPRLPILCRTKEYLQYADVKNILSIY